VKGHGWFEPGLRIGIVALIALGVASDLEACWRHGQRCGCVARRPAPCVPLRVYVAPPPAWTQPGLRPPSAALPSAQAPAPARRVVARGVFTSPSGRKYPFIETNEPGTEEELRRELAAQRARLTPLQRAMAAANVDNFVGTDRRDAKTSIADGPVETFTSLADLLASLPDDNSMLNHDPKITRAPGSDRVMEEERNVTVTAFIYVAKAEADNDFHLILGTGDPPSSRRYMNAEIAGLPPAGPVRARLKTARDAFKTFFADQPIGGGYRPFDVPIPVQVTGSLFYDVDHAPGVVGPEGFKPTTSWEIHPITDIQFEPQ
jgi:hypothetical protein